ncbi:hypothetical protein [Naumannella cuiyingiana]|uniref:Uncharacterized protein n=1 Tax=Naumannella cuiyingiana TaxID=1347891 RepID=A0A7Z0D7I8_9ACTN|nr:hypothetical protein [Naumannella cuiyingiana]NYI70201.1 hypothetical protein [Naumannella cuiyingiana]
MVDETAVDGNGLDGIATVGGRLGVCVVIAVVLWVLGAILVVYATPLDALVPFGGCTRAERIGQDTDVLACNDRIKIGMFGMLQALSVAVAIVAVVVFAVLTAHARLHRRPPRS